MKKFLLIVISALVCGLQSFGQSSPPLPCPGPITVVGETNACLNSEFEYATQIGHASWSVSSGGTILNPGGMFHSRIIKWNTAGPQSVTVTCGSYTHTLNVIVANVAPPPAPSAVTGNANMCVNQSATYSVDPQPNYSHEWGIVRNGALVTTLNTTVSGNQLTVNWSEPGAYIIYSYLTNGSCRGPAKALSVNVQDAPTLSITLESNNSCTYAYRANYTTNIDAYHWSASGGATIAVSENRAFITWPAPGTYTVSVYGTNTCFGNGPVTTITEVVGPPPSVEIVKVGEQSRPNSSCVGNVSTYYIQGSSQGDTYQWTLSGGGTLTTNGITATVNWTEAGSFTISASGSCFSNNPIAALTQTIGLAPNVGPIVLPRAACTSTPQAYYIESNEANNYSWWQQGTSFSPTYSAMQHYTFQSAGQYTVGVDIHNSFCAITKTAEVTVGANTNAVQTQPIGGPNEACINATNVNFIALSRGQGVWWAGNTNAVDLTVQGMNNETALATFKELGSHTLYFNYDDDFSGCTSATTSKTVYVTTVPQPTITGIATQCENDPNVITYTTESGKHNYSWAVSPGNTLSSTFTSSVTVDWKVAGPQTISVNYSTLPSSCLAPESTEKIIDVLPAPPATITPSGPVIKNCAGNTVTLTANTGSGLTHHWLYYGSYINETTNSINATGGAYSVRVRSQNGCSTISASVFLDEIKTSPGSISGGQRICVGGDPNPFTEWSPASGSGVLTYQWQSSFNNSTFTDINGATEKTYDPPAGILQTTYYKRITTNTVDGFSCSAAVGVLTVVVHNITGGAIAGDQTICKNGDPIAFTQTEASTGSSLVYQWESSTDNNVFTTISGANGTTYDVPSGLSQTTYYRRKTSNTLSGLTCTAFSNPLTVNVNSISAGSIGADQTICEGGDPIQFSETQSPSASGPYGYQWQSSPDAVSFTNIAGATNAAYDVSPGLSQTTYYKRIATSTLNGLACSDATNVLTVSINAVTPGRMTGDQTVCAGANPISFIQAEASTGTALTYQWKHSTDNNSFSDIAGANSATYDPPVLTQTTWYQRITTSTLNGLGCSATANTLTVTLNHVTPGTVEGDQTICSGGDPLAFTGTLPTGSGTLFYQWQSSVNNGTFTPVGGGTASTLNVSGGLTETTTYKRTTTSRLNNIDCIAESNPVTVSVNKVSGGQISGDQTICGYRDAGAFAEVSSAAGSGSITYQWQSSANGSAFTDISGATGSAFDDATVLTQTTRYQRIAISNLNGKICSASSNIITVWVNFVTGGVVSESQSICSNQDPAPFTVTTPATGTALTYQWQRGYDKLSMVDIAGATGETHDPTAETGTFARNSFRRIVFSTLNGLVCSTISNYVNLTILASPTATADNKSVCKGGVVALTGSPTGGTWSGPGVSGSNFYSSSLSAGTYTVTYTVTGSNGCQKSVNASVTVKPAPIITSFWGTAAVCPGNTYTYTANVSGTGTFTYTWTKPSNWTVVSQSGNTIRLRVPTYNASYGAVRVTVSNGSCTAQDGMTVYPGSCGGGGYPYPYQYPYTTVSPNPANTEMTVALSLEEETDSSVKVYSQTGVLLANTVIEKGKSDVSINTSELPNGIYLVEIKKRNGKSEFKRVVISH